MKQTIGKLRDAEKDLRAKSADWGVAKANLSCGRTWSWREGAIEWTDPETAEAISAALTAHNIGS